MKTELESTSNRKPRDNKYDPDNFLASIVASKLEEGNFKSAIRLICSEDKPALDTPETLVALIHNHPSAPIDRRTPCDPNSSERFKRCKFRQKKSLEQYPLSHRVPLVVPMA